MTNIPRNRKLQEHKICDKPFMAVELELCLWIWSIDNARQAKDTTLSNLSLRIHLCFRMSVWSAQQVEYELYLGPKKLKADPDDNVIKDELQ